MKQATSSLQSKPESAEVLVVGGSAAGLFAAYLLAREGKRVRLFDSNDVLHTSSRTLITTARLTEVLGFFPQGAVVNEIKEIELVSRQRSVTVPMTKPDLVVERAAIVRLLAQKAVDAGVEIHGACKFLHLTPSHRGVTVTVRNSYRDQVEQFETRTLIGADGTFSQVAKLANRNSHATTPILQAIVNLPEGAPAHTTRVWFEPQDTPYFYWLIPESPRKAALGFISDDSKNSKNKLERFLSRLGMKPVEIQAARIPSYKHTNRPWRRMHGADICLVGDAAAQVKVTTVGGLVAGLRGARAAASAIIKGADYARELRPLRRELSLHLLMRTILNRFQSADYDRLLELLTPRAIRLLGYYDRDQAAKMLCRLLFTQPRFLRYASFLFDGLWKK